MKFISYRFLLRSTIVAACAIALMVMNGCNAVYLNLKSYLREARAEDQFTVLTTKDPLIYYKNKNNEESGLDFDLLKAFAEAHGFNLVFKVLPNEEAVVRGILNGEGDIGAARLQEAGLGNHFLRGPAYEETYLSLFCHKNIKFKNFSSLNDKKVVVRKKDNFLNLKQQILFFAPHAQVYIYDNVTDDSLMMNISQNKIDCAIMENLSGTIKQRFNLYVQNIVPISQKYANSWIIAADKYYLASLMNSWFENASRSQEVSNIQERYNTYLSSLSRSDTLRFFINMRTRLPEYKREFKKTAKQFNIPWQLLAAVAYQESHWDPLAVSYTGVKGLMQLTNATAKHVGVEDRSNPEQSIWGGAKYLRMLLNQMPNNIDNRERINLALAAYNVGIYHLKDAQRLALTRKKNPYQWKNLKEVLPLLADPHLDEELTYGYARGYETVAYVERTRAFYKLLLSMNESVFRQKLAPMKNINPISPSL